MKREGRNEEERKEGKKEGVVRCFGIFSSDI